MYSYYRAGWPFECRTCDLTCSQKLNVRIHVESVHEGKKLILFVQSILVFTTIDWAKSLTQRRDPDLILEKKNHKAVIPMQ